MKVFCDTNVLVAGCCEEHPHHEAARPVLERIKAGKDEGFATAHSLAEAYAVLTRLPGSAAVDAGTAWRLISENVVKNFSIVALTAKEYAEALEIASASGVEGGRTYDLLILKAAEKSGATRVLTFNISHFRSLAGEAIRAKIVSP